MTSDPTALLSRLTGLGATVSADGDRLHIEAPYELPADLLAALRERKPELLRLLAAPRGPAQVAEALPFLGMPLDEFQRARASLEVRVPWLDVTLWLVPTDRDAAGLMGEGVERGRIWTAAELMQFMAIADRTPETVKTLTHAKLELDGEITEVRPRGDSR